MIRIVFITLFQLLFVVEASSQIDNNYLKVGDKAPVIRGIDQFNSEINSNKILQNKKILLLFYRGNWCPYCKKHLASLQENLEKFIKNGVFVIVVTPEKVEKIKETTSKFNSKFSIIHDFNNKIMNDYKVAFKVTKENVPKYFEFTLKRVREYNEKENNVLPVPATYMIDKNHRISYVHYDSDYKKRANLTEILNKIE
ncbi:hypothetical protein Lupro_04360 [Lutibacter profundi]|uniref:thioredoxin-dependent peroxiredoxin n=1 Tax=Lutibacter profundi TaxID=1622118 RepID=A0A109RN89_9FLAO|nr:peroxiredoxin-like family protein [Lutibacter profundi]AMC10522.1 hypothetical protein Lupro_04360 [Lutibacter profundi]